MFVAVGIVSAFVAWYWPGLGGSLLVVTGAALGVAAATRYTEQTALLIALVFVIPGVMFLIAWAGRRHIAWQGVAAVAVIAVMYYGGTEARARHEASFGPAHPQSELQAQRFEDVEWAWSGGVTSTGFVVNARIDPEATTARLAVSTSPSLSSPVYSAPIPVLADHDHVVSLRLDGLTPATRYHYAVEIDGELDQLRQGSASTFPAGGGETFSILVGSCARTRSNGRVFEAMRNEDALMYVVTGDIHYENITRDSIDRFREAYTTLVTSPAQQALFLETPVTYIWDDHDFGGSNSNSTSAAKKAARLAYRENVPHYPLLAGEGDEPIYTAFDIGDIRFVMTDSRSMRDAEDHPDGGKSLLGADQREWLKDELFNGSRNYRLVVLISAVPWIAPEDAARDDWGGYAKERSELANFIADNGISNLMMLAGDAHMLAIDDGTNTDYSDNGGGGFPLLHAAALDRPGSVKGGPYSEGAYPGAGQYGLVTFRYEGDSLTVDMAGRNWLGETMVAFSFQVSSAVAVAPNRR